MAYSAQVASGLLTIPFKFRRAPRSRSLEFETLRVEHLANLRGRQKWVVLLLRAGRLFERLNSCVGRAIRMTVQHRDDRLAHFRGRPISPPGCFRVQPCQSLPKTSGATLRATRVCDEQIAPRSLPLSVSPEPGGAPAQDREQQPPSARSTSVVRARRPSSAQRGDSLRRLGRRRHREPGQLAP